MGKIAGIDYGTKDIGIAVSDENHLIAERFRTIRTTKNRHQAQEVAKALSDQDIELVVLGMPLGLDGKPTRSSKLASTFGEELAQILDTDIKEWNETYTSQQAEGNITNQEKIHMESARIILQGYLDFLNSGI